MKKYLIVVDMQEGFITKEKRNYIVLVKKINNLIKLSKYDRIIFTKFKILPYSFYETKLNWNGLSSLDEQQLCVDIPKNSIIFKKMDMV